MNRGLFDFNRISPGIDGPTYSSVGRGRITVDGVGGSISMADLRALQESARPGYPMIGGGRRKTKSRRSRFRHSRFRHSRKNKKQSRRAK
jgi:hypothetical protein